METRAIYTTFDERVIADLLHSLRIRRHSQSWQDYERAKQALSEMGFNARKYEQALAVVAKLIGV